MSQQSNEVARLTAIADGALKECERLRTQLDLASRERVTLRTALEAMWARTESAEARLKEAAEYAFERERLQKKAESERAEHEHTWAANFSEQDNELEGVRESLLRSVGLLKTVTGQRDSFKQLLHIEQDKFQRTETALRMIRDVSEPSRVVDASREAMIMGLGYAHGIALRALKGEDVTKPTPTAADGSRPSAAIPRLLDTDA